MTATDKRLRDGLALHQSGNLAAARQAYLEVLEVEPQNAEAWQLLGVMAFQAGDFQTARGCLEQSLKINPKLGRVHQSLGQVLESLNQPEQALAAYRRAIELEPNQPMAWNNLGNLLQNQGNFNEAEKCFAEVQRLDPNFPNLLNNLGVLRLNQSRPEEALALFQRALERNPSHECYLNLGNALKDLNRDKEALAAFSEAVRLNPRSPSAYHNLASVLHSLNMPVEAVACLRQAMALPSRRAEYYHSSLLFLLNYLPDIPPEELLAEHVRWGQTFGQLEQLKLPPRNTDPDRPLRIGYVSPDLRKHPVARFLEPVFTHHDRERYKIFAYAEVARPDAMTEKLRSYTHGWKSSVGMSDRGLAELIAADQIDILVDLAGHTSNNRLLAFAHRPAPIQATWLGYPNTTGLPAMDYYLTDDLLTPPGFDHLFSEELYRIPKFASCFQPPESGPAVGPLPAEKNGCITFGCLHRPNKIGDAVLDLWADVMNAVPSARLLYFWSTLQGEQREVMVDRFKRHGIPAERFSCEYEIPVAGYLDIYNRVDIGLDVFPWTGGTTTHEALWMGVVVAGLQGDRLLNRGTYCILTASGHPELVAPDKKRYVELARDLAANPARLAQLRAGMRDEVESSIGDVVAFTRRLEDSYRDLWQRWCRKNS